MSSVGFGYCNSQSSKITSSSGTLFEDDPALISCLTDFRAVFFIFLGTAEELTTMRSSSESSIPITSLPFKSSSRNTSLTRIIKSLKFFIQKFTAQFYRDKDPTDSFDRQALLWLSRVALLPVCTSRAELQESLISPVHEYADQLE